MSKLLLTFVISTYNIPEVVLRRCLVSIVQTGDMDIPYEALVVVDGDGHEDRYRRVVDELGDASANIRVIVNPHGGANAARNTGIDQARGRWLCVVDADDKVDAAAIAKSLKAVDGHNDVAAILANHVEEYRSYVTTVANYPAVRLVDANAGAICVERLMKCSHNMGLVWGKLFRVEFLTEHGLRYNTNLVLGEDCEFILRFAHVLETANAAVLEVPYPIYTYIRNVDSITKRFDTTYVDKYKQAFACMQQELMAQGRAASDLRPFIAHVLLQITSNYIFNMNAHHKLSTKRALYRSVRDDADFADAIAHTPTSDFSRLRGFVFWCWKRNLFWVLYAVAIVRQLQFRVGFHKWN